MKTILFPASERGTKNAGWLTSKFSFSFSDYYNPMRSAFGTLVAFNDDLLETGKGFGLHPHVNMEIISILLKGTMNHKDSMGYSTVIDAGGVQIMSAGSGLRHEEYNVGADQVNFLQIWIEPKLQNVTPRYQFRNFPAASRKNKMVTLVSCQEGLGHCWINQNAKISIASFDAENQQEYAFDRENKCLFIFVIEGVLRIGDSSLGRRDAAGIWDCDRVSLQSGPASEYLIIETAVNQK